MEDTINLVKKLSNFETLKLTFDSKVVAIRWDLMPWSLVVDLDVPVSELRPAHRFRSWIVFRGISELTFPLSNTRLPIGIGLTSEISVTDISGDFKVYSFRGLLPSHAEDGSVLKPGSAIISIKAKDIVGLRSVKEAYFECGILDRAARVDLASNDEMLSELLKEE